MINGSSLRSAVERNDRTECNPPPPLNSRAELDVELSVSLPLSIFIYGSSSTIANYFQPQSLHQAPSHGFLLSFLLFILWTVFSRPCLLRHLLSLPEMKQVVVRITSLVIHFQPPLSVSLSFSFSLLPPSISHSSFTSSESVTDTHPHTRQAVSVSLLIGLDRLFLQIFRGRIRILHSSSLTKLSCSASILFHSLCLSLRALF